MSYGITIVDNTNLVRPANLTVDNTLHVQLTMQSQQKLYTEITSTLQFQTKREIAQKAI